MNELRLRPLVGLSKYGVRRLLILPMFFAVLAPLARCSVPEQNSSELAATLYSLVAAGVVLRPSSASDCPDDLATESGCGIPEGDD